RRWHATGAGSDQSPSLFRLTGRQTTLFILSLGFAFLFFTLLTSCGSGLITALLLSVPMPIGMLIFLLALCSGRYEGYAAHWLEWRLAKMRHVGIINMQNQYDKSH
ncbi:hypothetical protein, partial [Luteolibacter pohnpeiensis]|uniref:hypothetical protein n=1 Tax=Luteolibacter pohnpeiensis TaxID=454153 RepID=UPI001F3216F9